MRHMPVAVEHGGERRHVDDGGVDDGGAARPRQLQQGQPGVVGALPVELRVEAVGLGRRQLGEDLARTPRSVSIHAWVPVPLSDAQPPSASLPARSMGSPASIQASVPPATFTASMPWDR